MNLIKPIKMIAQLSLGIVCVTMPTNLRFAQTSMTTADLHQKLQEYYSLHAEREQLISEGKTVKADKLKATIATMQKNIFKQGATYTVTADCPVSVYQGLSLQLNCYPRDTNNNYLVLEVLNKSDYMTKFYFNKALMKKYATSDSLIEKIQDANPPRKIVSGKFMIGEYHSSGGVLVKFLSVDEVE